MLSGTDNIKSLNKENNTKLKINKRKKLILFIIISSIFLIILFTIIMINFKSNNKEIVKDYECTLIRTYNIDTINQSNNEI